MTPGPASRIDRRTDRLGEVSLVSLTWGAVDDRDRPLAVLLHGFPDTAHTWRHVAPLLAGEGWRVVAPFTRGYGPSGLPRDGSYHLPALMADAIALHGALGGDDRALLVGHDWGAITANGIAAWEGNPYGRVAALAVPPIPAMHPTRADLLDWARVLPRQAGLSWYTLFNQVPVLPERVFDRLVAHLWRRWSPGYDARDDLALLRASLPDRTRRGAAVGYYRAQPRPWAVPPAYAHLRAAAFGAPRGPLLYLHGADDGCLDVRWAGRAADRLPDGSAVHVVPGAGHFLQLEQPGEVTRRILDFVVTDQ